MHFTPDRILLLTFFGLRLFQPEAVDEVRPSSAVSQSADHHSICGSPEDDKDLKKDSEELKDSGVMQETGSEELGVPDGDTQGQEESVEGDATRDETEEKENEGDKDEKKSEHAEEVADGKGEQETGNEKDSNSASKKGKKLTKRASRAALGPTAKKTGKKDDKKAKLQSQKSTTSLGKGAAKKSLSSLKKDSKSSLGSQKGEVRCLCMDCSWVCFSVELGCFGCQVLSCFR